MQLGLKQYLASFLILQVHKYYTRALSGTGDGAQSEADGGLIEPNLSLFHSYSSDGIVITLQMHSFTVPLTQNVEMNRSVF